MILGSLTLASIYHMQLGVENEKSVTSAFTKYHKANASICGCSEFRFSAWSIVEVVFIPNICWHGQCYALGHIKPCNDCRA